MKLIPTFASLIFLPAFVAQAAENPNIIFMMLDDCSAVEFSCYATPEHPAAQSTPAVDRIAAEGLRFETCWATPLCMPTRALLMSGKYAYQTRQYGNHLSGARDDFAALHKPVSKVMQENGYRTGITGKWHLPGYVYEPDYGWDEWSMLGGYIGPNNLNVVWDGPWFEWGSCTEYVHEKAVIRQNKRKYPSLHWNGCVIENGKLLPSDAETYAPDLNQQFALDFIERNRERPFYLYYPCVLPHRPWMKTPEGLPGMESNVRIGITYLEQLVNKLKETGLYDNTIVFFTADNATQGYGKAVTSELGVRVPLIVFGGPIKARGVTKALVDFADMYPTTLALAGIDPATVSGLDGQSFKPVLDGEATAGKPFIFSYNDAFRTVRTRSHMMDGSGGIWKCVPSGNILDYNNITKRPEANQVREELLGLIERYPAPAQDQFKKPLYKRGKPPKWPTTDFATMRYLKIGDQWMDQADRKEP